MGAITGTLAYSTPLAGKRLVVITATLLSASDVITLSLASHGVRTLYAAWAMLTGGQDTALMGGLIVSHSGLAVTIASQVPAGTASTNWDSATIELVCIVD